MDGDDARRAGVFAHDGGLDNDLHVLLPEIAAADSRGGLQARGVDDAFTSGPRAVYQTGYGQDGVARRWVLHTCNQAVCLFEVLDQPAGRFGLPSPISSVVAIPHERTAGIDGERESKVFAQFAGPRVVEATDQHDRAITKIFERGRRGAADSERLASGPQLARNQRQRERVGVPNRIAAKELLDRHAAFDKFSRRPTCKRS